MNTNPPDRLLDLLAAEATQGLSEAETRELAGLLVMFPHTDPDSLAHAAAAADLALSEDPEPLPPHLAAQIEHQAMAYLGHETLPEPAYESFAPPPRPRTSRFTFLGWSVAAGLAAVFLWTQMPPSPPNLAKEYAKLKKVAGTQEFIGDKDGVTGNAAWHAGKQEGYIEVKGLPPLDPTKEKYQIWIVDGGRSDPQPVDGGLFDLTSDGTAYVRVNPRLLVKEAKMLAITKEVADGVVVSKGPMLLVLVPKPG